MGKRPDIQTLKFSAFRPEPLREQPFNQVAEVGILLIEQRLLHGPVSRLPKVNGILVEIGIAALPRWPSRFLLTIRTFRDLSIQTFRYLIRRSFRFPVPRGVQ